jgi:hypothetical protein
MVEVGVGGADGLVVGLMLGAAQAIRATATLRLATRWRLRIGHRS